MCECVEDVSQGAEDEFVAIDYEAHQDQTHSYTTSMGHILVYIEDIEWFKRSCRRLYLEVILEERNSSA